MYEQTTVRRTVCGDGENLLVCGTVQRLPKEILALRGQVQFVYLDPPS